MISMNKTIQIPTSQQNQFVDITTQVQEFVTETNIAQGIVFVFVPHTTAGITINEAADPDVRHDILQQLDKIVPSSQNYRHREGNSPAHIKASLMGSSVSVMIANGTLQLGTWQGIYLCEFDGPRTRQVWIKIIKG